MSSSSFAHYFDTPLPPAPAGVSFRNGRTLYCRGCKESWVCYGLHGELWEWVHKPQGTHKIFVTPDGLDEAEVRDWLGRECARRTREWLDNLTYVGTEGPLNGQS